MVKLVNRAKMTTATTGTGTITLGSAVDGYQTFAAAGVADADVVRYVIEDGNAWEIGTGTYTASGTTLSRTVNESSNSNAAINLSGDAVVFVSTAEADIVQLTKAQTLTNKTINGSNNTISNVSLTAAVTGTLPIANGGTGQTTANNAINELLPSQSGQSGKFLSTNGTNTSWETPASGGGGAAVRGRYTNGFFEGLGVQSIIDFGSFLLIDTFDDIYALMAIPDVFINNTFISGASSFSGSIPSNFWRLNYGLSSGFEPNLYILGS